MKQILKSLVLAVILASAVCGQGVCNSFQPVPGRCDLTASPVEQAKCLLRPVKKFANLGGPLNELPAPFDTLVGQPTETSISLEQLKRFLAAKGIRETDVGGSLSISLSKPKYFVIHDTSDFLELNNFPSNINDETSSLNDLSRRVSKKVCHVYINRVGQSATAVVFESLTPPPGTKFGTCHREQRTSFLHIENIQPRIRDRSVSFKNDAIAPDPGFTEAQLGRLALVYVVASVRSGKWLIPAYHSPIDLGYPDAHDDPQNFNLQTWSTRLRDLIEQVRTQ
ncbi:MAG TPA: hypothetical protein VI031_01835 [Pyrinomonadaceae bacterium]